jgi:phospholipase A-2-activating protein
MPNGDIVSGCSDGIVRVFSASGERWASEGDLKEYDDKVANQALPAQQVGDLKKGDLPGPEALTTPGVSMFIGIARCWSKLMST